MGYLSKIYGMLGATVITAVTLGTMAIPFRVAIFHCNIPERTFFCAQSTAVTCIGHTELGVCNEECIEKRLYNIGLKPWRTAQELVIIALGTFFYKFHGLIELFDGCVNLTVGKLRRIQLEALKINVCVWHLENKERVKLQACLGQVFTDYPHGMAGIVSAGTCCKYIIGFILQPEFPYIVRYQVGHRPCIYGEYYSQYTAMFQIPAVFTLGIGNEL